MLSVAGVPEAYKVDTFSNGDCEPLVTRISTVIFGFALINTLDASTSCCWISLFELTIVILTFSSDG
ncbi:hypothetical protein D3C79_912500 [compost metagenome]